MLGYPLLVAGIGAYLMVSYTMLKADVRQWRDEYRTEDMKPKVLDVGLAEPPTQVLAVLVAAPLILLVALWQTNDWPQLRNGDWRTALVVAVAIVIITAAGCYLYLKRPSASLRG